MPDKKLTREEKEIFLVKKFRRRDLNLRRLGIECDFCPITLSEILEYIRKKFKLKTLTPHITRTVAMWRFNHDDLSEQWNYCIDWVYYLVTVRLPKKPKNHEHNTNQKDGVQRGNKEVHNGD